MLFALSGRLNELGFMGYVGGKLAALLGGVAWPVAYVVLNVTTRTSTSRMKSSRH